MKKIEPWKCLKRKTVLDSLPWLKVESHHLRLPDGREIEDWQWVYTPDVINVVAVTAAGEFICFRQQKYAADGVTLAICGGYLEPEEPALAAAKRELQEECGYASEQWTALGEYAVDGNRGCGRVHLFLAESCRHVGGEITDDLEDQEMLFLSREEVSRALDDRAFQVLSWAAAVSMALRRIGGDSRGEA